MQDSRKGLLHLNPEKSQSVGVLRENHCHLTTVKEKMILWQIK